MARIASGRPRAYWLHTIRRLPPPAPVGSSTTAAEIASTILLAAVLKCGTGDDLEGESSDVFQDLGGELKLRELSGPHVLELLVLYSLAWDYMQTAANYRRVCKGAVLKVEHGEARAPAEAQTQALMESLDSRLRAHGGILSVYGTAATTDSRDQEANLTNAIASPYLNLESEPIPDALSAQHDIVQANAPNYLLGRWHIGQVREVFRLFAPEVRQTAGLDPDELIGVLWAIAKHYEALAASEFRFCRQYLQRGYFVMPDGRPLEGTLANFARAYQVYLAESSDSHLSLEEAELVVRRVFRELTYRPREFDDIVVRDLMPLKPVLRGQRLTYIDLTVLPAYLRAVFREVGALDGDRGNEKGKNFHREVLARINARANVSPWLSARELNTPEGLRDLDASFVAGSTLYLVECKAFAASARLQRGEYAAVKGRWDTLQDHLDQITTLRELLERYPVGANYQIPAEVTALEHCVCTPLPEWIPEPQSDAKYWLTAVIPRICTPSELLDHAATRQG